MINTLYRTIGNILSPQGEQARLSILIYHRVLPDPDPLFPYEVTAEIFDKQLTELNNVFNVIPLDEAIARLKTCSLPSRSLCITFDDGYADNVDIALPILKRHKVNASFFIATAYLNGGRMFNDTIIHAIRHSRDTQIDLTSYGLGKYNLETLEAKHRAIHSILNHVKYLPVEKRDDTAEMLADLISNIPPPTCLMMNTNQLKELNDSGMTIGGHTVRHPILSKLNTVAMRYEIAEGRDYLEAVLGIKVSFFAYPNGKPGIDYLPEQVDMLRKMGFQAALSTQWGTANRNNDIFQLPRFTPYAKNIFRFTPMLLQNMMRSPS
ncbi:MAG: polysaccharide deacetylase family protein [Proteobacteria bacterium]|nr:polysaccharide deacetylase family protein [Pseudomonadota bacterium]